jgi:acetolactate synthase-1/2/3 large subunit
MRDEVAMLEVIRNAVPNAFFVGDSTQPIYAGNLYYDHDRRGGWFNAATGFGALGYAIPAAIGVSVAEPDAPVICLTGDGGAQFSIAELMTAKDENLPITFIVWNNHGYGEIAASMREAGVDVIGCAPTPPDFSAIATACGMPFQSVAQDADAVAAALAAWEAVSGPRILEIRAG